MNKSELKKAGLAPGMKVKGLLEQVMLNQKFGLDEMSVAEVEKS